MSGLLIAVAVIGALACPIMMLLGRRGIGPGCAITGCRPNRRGRKLDDVEALRARHDEVTARIVSIESSRHPREPV